MSKSSGVELNCLAKACLRNNIYITDVHNWNNCLLKFVNLAAKESHGGPVDPSEVSSSRHGLQVILALR